MRHAVYEAEVYLRDLTPYASEPTVSLQLFLREVCDPDEDPSSFDVDVVCLADCCSFSYTDQQSKRLSERVCHQVRLDDAMQHVAQPATVPSRAWAG